jgi:hypothetical protein
VDDRLMRIYRAAARAYCLAKFNYNSTYYQDEFARERHIANDAESYLKEDTRDTWFRPMVNAVIAEYRLQIRQGRKKKTVHRDRIQELKNELAAMERQRDQWREATKALGDDNRTMQWMAMCEVVKEAERAMGLLSGVSMVFSRQSGRTAIGNALVPLMEALARYRHGPDAKVIQVKVK